MAIARTFPPAIADDIEQLLRGIPARALADLARSSPMAVAALAELDIADPLR